MESTVIGDVPRVNAGRRPGGLAVVDGERRLTWAEFEGRVNRLSHALVEELGLRGGDCVAIMANNCLEYVELLFASSRAGLKLTGLNIRYNVAEMVHQVADAGATVLFVGRGFEGVAAAVTEAKPVVRVDLGGGTGQHLRYEGLLDRASNEPIPSHGDAELPYSLTYTSGTTGTPRGALINSRNDFRMAEIIRSATEVQVDDVFLLVLPLFHKGGQFAMLHAMTVARPLVVLPGAAPEAVCSAIEAERATVFIAVPTIMKMLIDHLESSRTYDLSSLRHVCYGSNPIPVPQLKAFAHAFGCSLSQIGGGTEGGPALSLSRTDHQLGLSSPEHEHLLSSCGQVQPGVELRIVDEAGVDIANGQIGELLYRGESFVSGYLNQPEATASLWRDGWLHSGDLGYRDGDGYVYYVDRLGGRVKTGGEMVIAREVEELLATHPAVRAVSIVGVPDARWGEAVCAVVEVEGDMGDESAMAEELQEFVRRQLAAFKVPRHVVFVPDLPRTALGKIARGKVKEFATEATTQAATEAATEAGVGS
jgi:acyl-CoA synthetase (AMP-forming)/AMP-acid ligase II